MAIGVMCATEREINPLIAKMSKREDEKYICRTFYKGYIGETEIVAVIGGVGKVNGAITAQALIEHFSAEKIIFTGLAGGLDDSLSVGDIVVGDRLICHDIPMFFVNNENMFEGMSEEGFYCDEEMINLCKSTDIDIHMGTILTGDQFIEGDMRDELVARFDARCVDMESAAVAQVCWFYEVPLLVIRALSDFADEDAMATYEANAEKIGAAVLSLVEVVIVNSKN